MRGPEDNGLRGEFALRQEDGHSRRTYADRRSMVNMAQVPEAKSIRTMQTAPKVIAGHPSIVGGIPRCGYATTNTMRVAGHHIAVERWWDSQVRAFHHQRDEQGASDSEVRTLSLRKQRVSSGWRCRRKDRGGEQLYHPVGW